MYQHVKLQFIPLVHSSDKVNFRVSSPDWPQPSWTMLTPKSLNHLLICKKLYLHEIQSLLESRDQIGYTHS